MSTRLQTHETTVELTVTVKYRHVPAWAGIRERGGMQMEPDEPAHITVDSARIVGGPAIDVDLLDVDVLEAEILESERDARDYAIECAAEAQYESRRERMYAEGSL